MKKRKASLILYGIISLILISISFKVFAFSYENLLNSKKDYLIELNSFCKAEVNNILKDSLDNGTPEVERQQDYTLVFNYNETIAIESNTTKNYSSTAADFDIKFCFNSFPGTKQNICKVFKGTGDLSEL